MKKRKRPTLNRILAIGMSVFVAGYILLHLTPTIAVRTHLFYTGHHVAAFTSKVVATGKHDAPYCELYRVSPKISPTTEEVRYGMNLKEVEVKQWLLSWADYAWPI